MYSEEEEQEDQNESIEGQTYIKDRLDAIHTYIEQLRQTFKTFNRKYLCGICWCLLSSEQRLKHHESHDDALYKQKEFAKPQAFKQLAKMFKKTRINSQGDSVIQELAHQPNRNTQTRADPFSDEARIREVMNNPIRDPNGAFQKDVLMPSKNPYARETKQPGIQSGYHPQMGYSQPIYPPNPYQQQQMINPQQFGSSGFEGQSSMSQVSHPRYPPQQKRGFDDEDEEDEEDQSYRRQKPRKKIHRNNHDDDDGGSEDFDEISDEIKQTEIEFMLKKIILSIGGLKQDIQEMRLMMNEANLNVEKINKKSIKRFNALEERLGVKEDYEGESAMSQSAKNEIFSQSASNGFQNNIVVKEKNEEESLGSQTKN